MIRAQTQGSVESSNGDWQVNVFTKTDLVSTFDQSQLPDKIVSVREAIRFLSIKHEQGFLNVQSNRDDLVGEPKLGVSIILSPLLNIEI